MYRNIIVCSFTFKEERTRVCNGDLNCRAVY